MTIIRSSSHAERSAALLIRIKTISGSNTKPLFDRYDTKDAKYIVVTEDGHPISTCRLCPRQNGIMIIDKIAVIPACRKKGYKSIAVDAAEVWADELGYRCVMVKKADIMTQ